MAEKPPSEGVPAESRPIVPIPPDQPVLPSASFTPLPPIMTGPVEAGNEEFPVAFRHFARELAGTDDEVWTRYLQIRHGHRNMTLSQWRMIHHTLRHEPAHWHRG